MLKNSKTTSSKKDLELSPDDLSFDEVKEKKVEELIAAPKPQESLPQPTAKPMLDTISLEERIAEDLKVSFPGKGILEITPSGFGFLRPKYTPSADDIYASQSQIRKFWLRPGDEVEGLIRPPKDNEKYHGLLKIEKINGQAISEDQSRTRKKFNDLTSMYPDKQIVLETEADVLSTRIMDILSPIGFGQRGLIVSPPKAGKTTLLKNIAAGIKKNYPDVQLIAVLIGERPE